jgi:hypothetical protein
MSFDPTAKLTKLQGKEYLEVKWRLMWFRDVNKSGTIATELVSRTENEAVFRATVVDDQGASATAYGSETKGDFKDYTEKAETKAVGRALGYLGYGTQFAPEFEEGERIVDSPVDRGHKEAAATVEQAAKTFGGVSGKVADKISDPQRKRLFAISKGNETLLNRIIGKYGYEHTADISRSDYEAICTETEAMVKEGVTA